MKKILIFISVIIVGVALIAQAVYISYLVRKMVNYDMLMHNQEVALLTQLVQCSQDQINALKRDSSKTKEPEMDQSIKNENKSQQIIRNKTDLTMEIKHNAPGKRHENEIEEYEAHDPETYVNVIREDKLYSTAEDKPANKNNSHKPEQVIAQLIDDFEKQGNTFGGKSNTYMKEPSMVVARRSNEFFYGDLGKSLELCYKRASEGGPYGKGGWCGYYTVIKQGPRKYFDASSYTYLTFQVKGAQGEESFKIGVADESWDKREDSMKSEKIDVYLEEGKVTTDWQKAKIPLKDFWVDTKKLASIAVCFEAECFAEGGGKGTVYIDDLQFE